jgi:hypothetical protein
MKIKVITDNSDNIMIKTLKTNTTGKIILGVLMIFSTILFSCSKSACPTYMRPGEKVRLIMGFNDVSIKDHGSIPSPYKAEYNAKRIEKSANLSGFSGSND